MSIRLGDEAPNFTAQTTEGEVNFYDWLGDSWGVLFSHPKDYTPVCTTELGMAAKLKPEFDKRNVKIMGLSVDPLESHVGWEKDIEETASFEREVRALVDRGDELRVVGCRGLVAAAERKPAAGQEFAQ